MMFGLRQANEHRRQHCKYKCLYKRYKKFQEIHEYRKYNRYKSHGCSYIFTHRHGDEYYTDESKDYRVACKYICKKTYRQGKWLYKNAEQLN